MSLRRSIAWPWICSGDMYDGVPMMVPTRVLSIWSPPSGSVKRATPKSVSLAWPLVDRLPNQLNQMLGRRFDNGVDLSGGEWQKIALARAYLRKAQLLILDEPTAALDAQAEFEVFERFSDLTRDRMSLLISHRFSTVRMADRILVLGSGRLIEEGTHEARVAKSGKYASMFELQAASYR